jgi:hypothetical protein
MTAVWELDLPDSDKLVLLALADCANDEGHCWPSVRSLTIKCSKSERTIQGSIKKLVEEGHLIRREVPGKGCNYTVLPRNSCAPAKNAPAQGTTPTPAESADKPSRTINSEAKASSRRVVDAWDLMAEKHGLAKVRVLDASRRQMLRLRLNEHGEALLLEAIELVGKSPFLRGEGRDNKWRPNFDFILQPKSLRSLLEGTYGEEEKRIARTYQPSTPADCERSAQFWESQGNAIKAAEMRALGKALLGTPIGSAAKKILEGVRPQ